MDLTSYKKERGRGKIGLELGAAAAARREWPIPFRRAAPNRDLANRRAVFSEHPPLRRSARGVRRVARHFFQPAYASRIRGSSMHPQAHRREACATRMYGHAAWLTNPPVENRCHRLCHGLCHSLKGCEHGCLSDLAPGRVSGVVSGPHERVYDQRRRDRADAGPGDRVFGRDWCVNPFSHPFRGSPFPRMRAAGSESRRSAR